MPCVRPLLAVCLFVVAAGAHAQEPRPARKGPLVAVTIDSSPQQAAIYLDDRKYGIVGYTPYSGKLEKGSWTLVLELPGYRSVSMPISVGDKHDFFVPLEKGNGTVDVQAASDPNVAGATLYIDGESKGAAPRAADLPEGRHLIELRRPGVGDFSQWVAIRAGERVTLTPILKGPQKGALLIDADVTAATISVDGKRIADTTPALVEGLDEGPHAIEVSKSPTQTWKQTVNVKAGTRTKIIAGLAQQAGGPLRVLASVAEAEIFVDGTDRGRPPLDVGGLAPGDHFVEAKAPGYADKSVTLRVEAGKSQVVKLDLVRGTSGPSGRLRVTAPADRSTVFIDGTSVGPTPLEREVAAGDHLVVVEHEGQTRFERTVTVPQGSSIALAAEQRAVGGVRFQSTPVGASVLIDGADAGKTPLIKTDLPVGNHLVTFRAAGYRELQQPVVVQGGEPVVMNAVLKPATDLTPEEEVAVRRGLSSYGADTVPVGRVTLDASIGYPYWLELRATTGVTDIRPLALDVAFGFRSTLQTWDVLLSGRLRLAKVEPFALAAFAMLGGGGGADGRNQFSLQTGVIGSILFARVATVSARLYADIWNDRLCSQDDNGAPIGTDVCKGTAAAADIAKARKLHGSDDLQSRDVGARLFLSVIGEVALSERTSFFMVLEGAPFQDERAAFSNLFTSTLLSDSDPIYNVRAGFTYKF